jgi:hypothetical protein
LLPEDPVDPHEIDPYYNGFDTEMGDDHDEADAEYTEADDDDHHDSDDDDESVAGSSH